MTMTLSLICMPQRSSINSMTMTLSLIGMPQRSSIKDWKAGTQATNENQPPPLTQLVQHFRHQRVCLRSQLHRSLGLALGFP